MTQASEALVAIWSEPYCEVCELAIAQLVRCELRGGPIVVCMHCLVAGVEDGIDVRPAAQGVAYDDSADAEMIVLRDCRPDLERMVVDGKISRAKALELMQGTAGVDSRTRAR